MDMPNTTGRMRGCCIKKEFRTVVKQETVKGPTGPCVSTRTRCVVCGNNHYLMEVPPVPIGISGAAL